MSRVRVVGEGTVQVCQTGTSLRGVPRGAKVTWTMKAQRFLDALRAAPHARGLQKTAGVGRRAAIAAIFRTHPSTGEEQVLFIRRALNPKDPWSGNVALPGGRQGEADGGNDETTAIRETREEIGLDLSSDGWERLGRLVDDRIVQTRISGKPLAVSLLGFAARAESPVASSELALQSSEVADAWWVDTRYVDAANLDWRHVELSSMISGLRRWPMALALLRMLRSDSLRFAAIALPPPPTADAPVPDPLPNSHPRRAHFELWGLTLGFFSDLLRSSGAGQPLVGGGAPPVFQHSYTATTESPVARANFALLEHAQKHGAQRTAATVLGVGASVVVGLVASVAMAVGR